MDIQTDHTLRLPRGRECILAGATLWRAIRRLLMPLGTMVQIAIARRQFDRLDDHILKDIGLSRGEIEGRLRAIIAERRDRS